MEIFKSIYRFGESLYLLYFLFRHCLFLHLTLKRVVWNLQLFAHVISFELKAHVSLSDHLLSVVHLTVRPSVHPSVCELFTFSSSNFPRTTGQISTKLSTKHHWMKRIEAKLFKWSAIRPFLRGDNMEIGKIHWWTFKIFFFKTPGPISIKHGTKHC